MALLVLVLLGACAKAPVRTSQDLPQGWSAASSLAVSPPPPGGQESAGLQRARLRLALAGAYYQRGQDEVALEELELALAAEPRFAEAWSLRGLAQWRLGRWAEAERSLTRALELAPGDADAAHNLGWLLCQKPGMGATERWRAAQPWFDRALARSGPAQPARTWAAQGLCQQQAGVHDQAERSLRQAWSLEPGQARSGWPLAQLLAAQARWREALEVLMPLHEAGQVQAASLWLGIRAARKIDNQQLASVWSERLRRDFGLSPQAGALEKGLFDE